MQNKTLQSRFLLRPEITFLNFGSFGACPKPVFQDYQRWQLELEQEPVQFIAVNGIQYLKQSREALGAYVGAAADDLVYVPNPSYAVNIIAKSFDLKPGDEILATNLEYGACDKTWNYYCKKSGAVYVRQPIELPVKSRQAFIDQFFNGLSDKTRMVFISHITSTTGMILPVEEICEIAKSKGLITFVDGAHTPGHIPLDLGTLKADIYTGACHKWMLTPKGCSFLYMRKEYQYIADPLVVSWGYDSAFPSHSRFLDYHQMQGTRDFSAFLTVPAAIAFLEENNWPEVARECRNLVQRNAPRFCELLKTQPLCPITDDFIGQMFSIPIQTEQPEALQRLLFEVYKIEIPVMRHDARVFLRYSINAFNSQADLDRLYSALENILATTDFIRLPGATEL
ncbi:MAG: aminotransferase class V-fold PLP-dependent enzyme [Bacteroidetes bacterium]|nr:aminotransferase class V-fold PLP-dependent enzyme [Bacteroidota bacterium]